MASRILLGILSKTRAFSVNGVFTRTFASPAATAKKINDLFGRICAFRNPGASVVPAIDEWALEGRKVSELELQRIIRDLRARKRYAQALEVSEWMSQNLKFKLADHAVQLDLMGAVRGVESAESYFNSLADEYKTNQTYGALLNCYVRERLVDKSLSVFQKMKEMGLLSNPLNYNNIMALYAKTDQFEKAPDVFSEMKEDGISPDNYSYRLLMTSYGSRSDLDGMKKVLDEMEKDPGISMDWLTYCMVANNYMKSGLDEQALIYLKKGEEKVGKDPLGYNHLIPAYASLGKKDEMMRLWKLQKVMCKKHINRDYITMLGSLVKIDDLEEAEQLLKEWESSCQTFDFQVPNTLLIGYCQKGLVEKAEATLRDIVSRNNVTPTPNSWSIIAAGYESKNDMEKAVECFKEALAVEGENKGWRPKLPLISSLLSWLGDKADVEDVEAFTTLLRTKVSNNKEIDYALMKACNRVGKEVHGLLERMEPDKIDQIEKQ